MVTTFFTVTAHAENLDDLRLTQIVEPLVGQMALNQDIVVPEGVDEIFFAKGQIISGKVALHEPGVEYCSIRLRSSHSQQTTLTRLLPPNSAGEQARQRVLRLSPSNTHPCLRNTEWFDCADQLLETSDPDISGLWCRVNQGDGNGFRDNEGMDRLNLGLLRRSFGSYGRFVLSSTSQPLPSGPGSTQRASSVESERAAVNADRSRSHQNPNATRRTNQIRTGAH